MEQINLPQIPETELGVPAAARHFTPAPDLPSGAYADSREHLWDELHRIDYLIRAQTLRWRLTIADSKPQRLWGMVHVTDDEVDRYLDAPFLPPGELPPELDPELSPFWRAAETIGAAIGARLDQTPPSDTPRLARLQRLFHLSDFERDLLLVCLAPELESRYRRLYGYLLDDASRTRPTVELALQMLYPVERVIGARTSFDPGAPLVRRRLLVVNGDPYGEEPLAMRSLRCDDRIANYVLGGDAIDHRLESVVTLHDPQESPWADLLLEPERLTRWQSLSRWWRESQSARDVSTVVFLHGSYGSGRRKAALAFCADARMPLLLADVEAALGKGDWERTVDLCYREAALRGGALYWANCDALLDLDRQTAQSRHYWERLTAAATEHCGLSFLAGRTAWEPAGQSLDSTFLRFDFPAPDFQLRQRIWEKHLALRQESLALAGNREIPARTLANAFQFTEGQVADALASAHSHARQREPHGARITLEDIYEGCRRQSSRRLVAFAKRIEPRTNLSFDNLILPPSNKRQLEELRARIGSQKRLLSETGFERRLSLGKGLIALFTGSSGTGKTMAAELLARDQGVDLYKVDLSAVISKYVGETEKNLGRVFDEAEDCNAMLFFDEADAIFGKRGKVEEARDRWANIEVNYLLQRVEEYSGTVILASNLRQNIDEAFLRRIHVVVEFPFPESQARLHIWRGMFPPEIERPSDDDLRSLSEAFRLPGGSIRNIVVDAASRALGEANGHGPSITLRHLALSTAREYQKLGKPITKGEFGVKFFDWISEEILMNANE